VATDEHFAATRKALADQMSAIDAVLPGSVVVRLMRCGNAGCACRADPPTLHGPYNQWTRTVNGKTVTRYLSDEELAHYQQWFDNARDLKQIIAKLEIASVKALEINLDNTARPRHRRTSRRPNKATTPE
jgi:hypothetical protein